MKVGVGACALMFVVLPATAIAQFTDWSAPVNLGPPVNSPEYTESCVAISKNGLSLFFSSNRQTGVPYSTDRDLYVSKRDSIDDPWGDPQPLTTLNTTAWESCPALSLDEHRLYFTSPRPGGCGGQDIWVSRRQDRRDDLGWKAPVNLGCAKDGYVNSAAADLTPTFFENEAGRVVMYFSSNRLGSTYYDFYQSEMRDDDTFGPATPIVELNGPGWDQGVTVRRDGLEVIFLSDRGNPESMDFWKATRTTTAGPWSVPVFVPSLGNPAYAQGRIALSFDARELYFTSWWPDLMNTDLWVARREKLQGKKK